jgi:hypothetical protein
MTRARPLTAGEAHRVAPRGRLHRVHTHTHIHTYTHTHTHTHIHTYTHTHTWPGRSAWAPAPVVAPAALLADGVAPRARVVAVAVAPEGNPGGGEGAVALAGRLVDTARDKSSCLSQALKDEFAGVKAMWTETGIDRQVSAGNGDGPGGIARVCPALWPGKVDGAARAARRVVPRSLSRWWRLRARRRWQRRARRRARARTPWAWWRRGMRRWRPSQWTRALTQAQAGRCSSRAPPAPPLQSRAAAWPTAAPPPAWLAPRC